MKKISLFGALLAFALTLGSAVPALAVTAEWEAPEDYGTVVETADDTFVLAGHPGPYAKPILKGTKDGFSMSTTFGVRKAVNEGVLLSCSISDADGGYLDEITFRIQSETSTATPKVTQISGHQDYDKTGGILDKPIAPVDGKFAVKVNVINQNEKVRYEAYVNGKLAKVVDTPRDWSDKISPRSVGFADAGNGVTAYGNASATLNDPVEGWCYGDGHGLVRIINGNKVLTGAPYYRPSIEATPGADGFRMNATVKLDEMKAYENASFSFGVNKLDGEEKVYLDEAFIKFDCAEDGKPVVSQVGGNSSYDDAPLLKNPIGSEDGTFELEANFRNNFGKVWVDFSVNGKLVRTWATPYAFEELVGPRYFWAFDADATGIKCNEIPTATLNESVEGWTYGDGYGLVRMANEQYLLSPGSGSEDDFCGPFVRPKLEGEKTPYGFKMNADIDLSNVKAGEHAAFTFGLNGHDGKYINEIVNGISVSEDGVGNLYNIYGLKPSVEVTGTKFNCEARFNTENEYVHVTYLVNGKVVKSFNMDPATNANWPLKSADLEGPRYVWYLINTADGALVNNIPTANYLTHAEAHRAVAHAGVSATCDKTGVAPYWICKECDCMYADEAMSQEVSVSDLVIPAKGHSAVATAAKTATCEEAGNIAYWTCDECEKIFADKACTEEITSADTVIPAKGHSAVATAAKAATCEEAGNIAYWTCDECGKIFADAACTEEITEADTVVPAMGHKLVTNLTAKLVKYDVIKLNWTGVEGATSYDIYYRRGADSYVFLKNVTNTSFVTEHLLDGQRYAFRIVAKGDSITCDHYVSVAHYTLKRTRSVKVAPYAKLSVRITWKNISGETGYQISRSATKTGTKVVKTLASTKAGSKVLRRITGYYKVRAYKVVDGKRVYAPWSSVVRFVR